MLSLGICYTLNEYAYFGLCNLRTGLHTTNCGFVLHSLLGERRGFQVEERLPKLQDLDCVAI